MTFSEMIVDDLIVVYVGDVREGGRGCVFLLYVNRMLVMLIMMMPTNG